MIFYDHIIVGGGILGASIAYHISRKSNDSILVIERNDFASAASSRSAGLVLQGSTKQSNIPLAKKTVEVISKDNLPLRTIQQINPLMPKTKIDFYFKFTQKKEA